MLSDTKIKRLKPQAKRIRRSDGDGLYIIIEPSGRKYFALEYRQDGKIRRKVLGEFLKDLNLKSARIAAQNLKNITSKLSKNLNYEFDFLIEKFLNYQQTILRQRTFENKSSLIRRFIVPKFRSKLIYEITRDDILALLANIELLGAKTQVKRVFNTLNQFFNFCYLECENNPCASIKIEFIARKYTPTHHPVVRSQRAIAELLRDISSTPSRHFCIQYALKFMMFSALRSNNICLLHWSEIDLAQSRVKISREKMKNNKDFILPLSRQAKDLLAQLLSRSDYEAGGYVFYKNSFERPILRQDLSAFLHRAGYKNIMRPHSFRTLFSTVCNEYRREHGIFHDVIERCLAHEVQDLRSVYNRAQNYQDMATLMQWYADFLDLSATAIMS